MGMRNAIWYGVSMWYSYNADSISRLKEGYLLEKEGNGGVSHELICMYALLAQTFQKFGKSTNNFNLENSRR